MSYQGFKTSFHTKAPGDVENAPVNGSIIKQPPLCVSGPLQQCCVGFSVSHSEAATYTTINATRPC